MSDLRLFAFSPAFGLPTSGPFALKLETWLRMVGIEYERVYEDDTRKGPKGKNPWIEIDGQRMGDTELIIRFLSERYDVDLDGHLTPVQTATALAVRRMVEEHLHQALEYELIVLDEGFRAIEPGFDAMPWPVRGAIKKWFRGHFRRQLHARGLTRHEPADINAMGIADLKALEALIGGGPYLFGEAPCTADTAVYGMVALMVFSPIQTPIMTYARESAVLSAYCQQIRDSWFPDLRELKRAA